MSAPVLAVLTSGGDAPGMNAVVDGLVTRAHARGARVLGVHGGFAGLAEGRFTHLEPATTAEHAGGSGTFLGSSRFAALALADGDGAARCRHAMAQAGVRALAVIGGNGSLEGARRLGAGAVAVAFVPATIDGDVAGGTRTVGADSAIAYALSVIAQLRVTGSSLPGRAFLLQTLGGTSGNLAVAVGAAAGIADVLAPETAATLHDVAARLATGAATGEAIAVMSEAFGDGDGVEVAARLAVLAGVRVHPTILGHAQRAAPVTTRDRVLAQAAGEAVVDALIHSRSAFVRIDADGAPVLRRLAV